MFSFGSALHRPNVPGLAAHGFDVDTYDSAARLRAHPAALRGMPATLARNTVVVVGAGLTRIEVACEMPHRVASATIIWCAGMRQRLAGSSSRRKRPAWANPGGYLLRVQGTQNAFAAGDAAWCMMDDVHRSVMSCQDGRPMGRFAGHNVVADLVGEPMLPSRIESYVTVLDLGPWGALYTTGRDRSVASTGAAARATKRLINRQRIYPPRSQRDSHRRGAAGAECALRVQVIAAGSAMHDDNTY